jgi:DNA (cytosine-5)-methyltransferase 1
VRIWIENSTGLLETRTGVATRRFPGIAHSCTDVTNRPHPTVDTRATQRIVIEWNAESRMPARNDKPPYRIPAMAEIAATPHNGYRVASTFSGCGGSSLGYRWAGFKVVWANEFIPAAQAVYRANFPDTPLDTRDIRTVTGAEILGASGLRAGELDLLDGSPPCASFSMAGARSRHWGAAKKYSDTTQRTDDLFFEFARLLRELQPRTFVAENVSGLVKGVAKGYFLDILATLKAAGYRVGARVLDAQWLGVPQARARLIFVGVRGDLRGEPAHPRPLPYRYSVREALPWIEQCASNRNYAATWRGPDAPAPTIATACFPNGGAGLVRAPPVEAEADMRRYASGRELAKLAQGEQSDRYFQLVRAKLAEPCGTITAEGGNPSAASVAHPTEIRKFSIAELRRVCGFPDDFALSGSFAQQWERLGRAVPPPMMRAIAETIRDQVLRPLDQDAAA